MVPSFRTGFGGQCTIRDCLAPQENAAAR
jgi:hypothetical protein